MTMALQIDRPPAEVELPEAESFDFDELDATVRLGDPTSIVLGPNITLSAFRNLGPYELIEQLGSGGMGIVFAARHRETGEQFAIKILRPSLIMEPEAKQRFSREAQAMATIGHQRIVPVIRVGEEHGIPYIVMPLLRGETLEARLHHNPPLDTNEIIRIGAEIAEGLSAAHHRGLVHRDIKPANIWLEKPDASVCLLDLGLVRDIAKDSLLTNSGVVMGTPAYMSPEQARGDRIGPASDLFSLGCILYQLTTGCRPFEGPTPLIVLNQLETYHPPRVTARNPLMPTLLSNLIMELLAKQPKDRPPSAENVVERLRRIPILDRSRQGPPIVSYNPDEPIFEFGGGQMEPEPPAMTGRLWLPLLATLIGIICYFTMR